MEFLVLPDTERAAGLLPGTADPPAGTGPAPDAGQVLTHASGRPWVAGRWRRDEAVLITAGSRRLLVLGRTRLDAAAAERRLASARSPHDLDALARRLPGSVHLVASMDGRVRVHGSVSTARQVFHADVAGLTVAASGQGRLASLLGHRFDDGALTLRLLTPGAPWPLGARPVWRGVGAVAPGAWLELTPDGGHRTHRWWTPPEPELPLEDAARQVREALCEAVEVRTGHGALSADLSGGLDSTVLCYLAASRGADLLTFHWTPADAANEDTAWARRAAADLPCARHRFVASDARPEWLAATQDRSPAGRVRPEGPPRWHRNLAQMEHLSRSAAVEGSRLHMMGVGGDELFSPPFAHWWSLVRERPLHGLATVRRLRTANRWSRGDTVRYLADRRSFAAALADAADGLTAPVPRPNDPPHGWGVQVRMPPWAEPGAVDAARRLLREAAGDGAEPLHRDRAQHQVLEMVVASGGALREANAALTALGVPWEAPYLDDRVVEAALRVRVADRGARGRYKPVLAAAVRGLVPERVLQRRSKGEFSAELHEGLRRNRGALVRWCEDLRLARLGLVDAGALRDALLAPMPHVTDLTPFENTLACESWLRAAGAGDHEAVAPAGGPG
ncbi:lasso peptide isopeptide bond-forming cyclase [Streptomyces capparidis]